MAREARLIVLVCRCYPELFEIFSACIRLYRRFKMQLNQGVTSPQSRVPSYESRLSSCTRLYRRFQRQLNFWTQINAEKPGYGTSAHATTQSNEEIWLTYVGYWTEFVDLPLTARELARTRKLVSHQSTVDRVINPEKSSWATEKSEKAGYQRI